MTSIKNEYFIDIIITANEWYYTINACFEVFHLNQDATAATVKNLLWTAPVQ